MGFTQKCKVRKSNNVFPQDNRAKEKDTIISVDAEKAFGNTQLTPFMLKSNQQNGNVWTYAHTL